MRRLPPRQTSKAAKWALRVSVFAPVLATMSVLAHRADTIDTQSFLVLLVVIGLIALVGLLLVFLAFRSLWTKGKRGGRRATWAFFFSALVIGPFVYAAALRVTTPRVTEVSTDLIDPPTFRAELLTYGDSASTLVAGELVDAYADVTSRRYNATIDVVYNVVLGLADDRGWQISNRRGRIGADDELIAEFEENSLILGMPRKIVIRVFDEGETALLDMRAKSVFGDHDLGTNARLIRRFIADTDFALIGQVQN